MNKTNKYDRTLKKKKCNFFLLYEYEATQCENKFAERKVRNLALMMIMQEKLSNDELANGCSSIDNQKSVLDIFLFVYCTFLIKIIAFEQIIMASFKV